MLRLVAGVLALAAVAAAQTSVVGEGGASSVGALTDVTLTSESADDILEYDGSGWLNVPNPVSTAAPVGSNGGNIFIGGGGGSLTGTGINASSLTAVGVDALRDVTSGHLSVAVGKNALLNMTTGNASVAVGVSALSSLTTGSSNVGVGHFAGSNITTGIRNTLLGSRAGNNLNTNTDSIMIGYEAYTGASGSANEIVVGFQVTGAGSNTATWGNGSITRHIFTSGTVEADDLQVYDDTPTTGATTAVVKAGAGQSTTDLTQWQDNAGAVLGRITSDGYGKLPAVQLVDPGAKPSCTSDTRGMIWYDAGGAGVADTAEICGKDASDVYAWVAIATF